MISLLNNQNSFPPLFTPRLLAAATPSIPEEPSQLSSPGAPLKRQTSAIPEGDNEDGDEEDLDGFPEDEEPAVSVFKVFILFFIACVLLLLLVYMS